MINTSVYKNSCDQINRKGNDLTELCVCKKTTTTTILINANICEPEELCGFFFFSSMHWRKILKEYSKHICKIVYMLFFKCTVNNNEMR